MADGVAAGDVAEDDWAFDRLYRAERSPAPAAVKVSGALGDVDAARGEPGPEATTAENRSVVVDLGHPDVEGAEGGGRGGDANAAANRVAAWLGAGVAAAAAVIV
uniref:hypothetical protein n=1 Tax=uncultured Mycobacterium sp. TaxID=171292 RepID=UPI0035CAFCB0